MHVLCVSVHVAIHRPCAHDVRTLLLMLWYGRDRQGCCITTALNSTLHCKPKVTCTHLCQGHDATTQSIVLYIATL